MSCAGFIEPLNLQCLFVNMFMGSIDLFTFFMAIIISILAARFRMPNYVFLASIGLFGIIMSRYISYDIYVLLILLIGILAFSIGKKIWTRE